MNSVGSEIMVDSNIKVDLVGSIEILTVGDPHFKTSNVMEIDEMCSKTIALAKDRNPNVIVILGDVLDTHERIHVVPLSKSIEWIQNLSSVAPVYVLIGNHDRPNNSDFLSNLHPYNGLDTDNYQYDYNEMPSSNANTIKSINSIDQENINKYNIKIVYQVYSENIGGFDFLFVPYVPPGRFMEAINTHVKTEELSKYSMIFAHQEFKNAKMGAIKSIIGDTWSKNDPAVVSGHIHDYDHLESNIIYTGTPMQHAFGDSTNKTVSYYTFIQNDIKENISDEYKKFIIPNINNIYVKEDRIGLKLPKKRIFYVSCDEVPNWEPPSKGLIKVVIRGTPAEIKATMKLKILMDWEKRGIKVSPKAYDDSDLINKDGDTKLGTFPDKIKISSYYDDLNEEIEYHDKYVKHWHYELSKFE